MSQQLNKEAGFLSTVASHLPIMMDMSNYVPSGLSHGTAKDVYAAYGTGRAMLNSVPGAKTMLRVGTAPGRFISKQAGKLPGAHTVGKVTGLANDFLSAFHGPSETAMEAAGGKSSFRAAMENIATKKQGLQEGSYTKYHDPDRYYAGLSNPSIGHFNALQDSANSLRMEAKKQHHQEIKDRTKGFVRGQIDKSPLVNAYRSVRYPGYRRIE